MNQSFVNETKLINFDLFFHKFFELKKRFNTEAAAHRCCKAVLKKSEAAVTRCSSK